MFSFDFLQEQDTVWPHTTADSDVAKVRKVRWLYHIRIFFFNFVRTLWKRTKKIVLHIPGSKFHFPVSKVLLNLLLSSIEVISQRTSYLWFCIGFRVQETVQQLL
jgi:hypothetical protein